MNRKELSEIRSHFKPEAKYFTLERVLTAFVDAQRNVRGVSVRNGSSVQDAESTLLFDTMRKVLNCNLGKQSNELPFRNHAYSEDGAQTYLASVLASELRNDEVVQDFLNRLAETLDSESPYAVFAAYCLYDTPRKNKMDEIDDEAESDGLYRYLVVAFVPTKPAESKLVYNREGDAIAQEVNESVALSKLPAEGFLYPVFTDRVPDVHHVLYYTKTPNEPNAKLVEEFLECDLETSIEDDKESMKTVLEHVLGDDLTYETVTAVNTQLLEIAAKNKTEEAPTELTGHMLHRMLSEAGVPEEKLVNTEEIFSDYVESTLKPERLVSQKTVIKTADIVVQVKQEAKDRVHLQSDHGGHQLVIELDDVNIEVNGFDLKVPGMLEAVTAESSVPMPEVAEPICTTL